MTWLWWSTRSSTAAAMTLVAEHVAPLGDGLVGGHEHAASLVASADELEEQVGRLLLERQDEQHRVAGLDGGAT